MEHHHEGPLPQVPQLNTPPEEHPTTPDRANKPPLRPPRPPSSHDAGGGSPSPSTSPQPAQWSGGGRPLPTPPSPRSSSPSLIPVVPSRSGRPRALSHDNPPTLVADNQAKTSPSSPNSRPLPGMPSSSPTSQSRILRNSKLTSNHLSLINFNYTAVPTGGAATRRASLEIPSPNQQPASPPPRNLPPPRPTARPALPEASKPTVGTEMRKLAEVPKGKSPTPN